MTKEEVLDLVINNVTKDILNINLEMLKDSILKYDLDEIQYNQKGPGPEFKINDVLPVCMFSKEYQELNNNGSHSIFIEPKMYAAFIDIHTKTILYYIGPHCFYNAKGNSLM